MKDESTSGDPDHDTQIEIELVILLHLAKCRDESFLLAKASRGEGTGGAVDILGSALAAEQGVDLQRSQVLLGSVGGVEPEAVLPQVVRLGSSQTQIEAAVETLPEALLDGGDGDDVRHFQLRSTLHPLDVHRHL